MNFYQYKLSRAITSRSEYSFIHRNLNSRISTTDIEKFDAEISCKHEYKKDLQKEFESFVHVSKIQKLFDRSIVKRKKRKIEFGENRLKTIFSDEEVIHLAAGVRQHDVNVLARNYKKGFILSTEQWYFLHSVMMNGVEKFGYEYIQELLNLGKVPFRVDSKIHIFKLMDKLKAANLEKIIRLRVGNTVLTCEYESKIGRDFILKIYQLHRNGTKSLSMSVKRNGYCKLYNFDIIPIFEIVQSITSGLRECIYGYGLMEGKCSICNKPLTDPKSIKKGIGPVCDRLL
jgi:hypothetical protein